MADTASRPRYHVATVGGDRRPRRGGVGLPVGLSAHVIDRPNACKVVATFRSEDQQPKRGAGGRMLGCYTRGQEGAVAAAEALAAEWNADDG